MSGNRNRIFTGILLVLGITSFVRGGFAQETIPYADLVQNLTNLERLARLPGKHAKHTYIVVEAHNGRTIATGHCWQEGSTLSDIDAGQVLADMKGPGVLNRIWIASPGAGSLKIYLDGRDTAFLELSCEDVFRSWGWNFPNLVYRSGRSYNFMIPVPYNRSCRIVAADDWGAVAQFSVTTFTDPVELPSFQAGFGDKENELLRKADQILGQRTRSAGVEGEAGTTAKGRITIGPGETMALFNKNWAGVITSIRILPEMGKLVPSLLMRPGRPLPDSVSGRRREFPSEPGERDALRELLFSVYWDGEKKPSILTPLGDFFGSAPGWNICMGLPAGMTRDLFYSNWYMPYGKGARILVRNDGKKARTLGFEIGYLDLSEPLPGYGRFHAKWIREDQSDAGSEWTLLKAFGPGRYCGLVIDIYNPKGIWWGDTEYRFTVDGEKSPSVSGRGLDVYFGAWANNYFSKAYHAHSLIDRSMVQREHESLNRWHIADDIPFQQSLEIGFRKHSQPSDSVLYTATLFWYQYDGENQGSSDIPLDERLDYPRVLSDLGITNCTEGEDLDVRGCSGGEVSGLYVEGLHTGGWSGMRGKEQLWWRGVRPGDSLCLSLPVENENLYKMRIQFINGRDCGVFRIYLDDRLVADSLDLYHHTLSPSAPEDFGLHSLEKGEHTLSFVALDSRTEGETFQFGLDFVQLESWDRSRDPKPAGMHVYAGEFVNIYSRNSINDHCFIRGKDGRWHFYGIGGSKGFAHGSSPFLLDREWDTEERPFPVEWDPWREIHLWAPHVVENNGLYYMFYCAGAKTGYTYRMHLATSPDLKNWTRHGENPLFSDGFDARDPMVLKVGDRWVMYYCANTDHRGGNHVVAYRLSDDLVHWGERHIAFVDPRRHKAGGPTESPFVVRRGDTYYLFIGPREGYVGTDIFASKDPFHWQLEDRVGHIDSHAAEVVRDVDGKWYVSHSGVGEGGLYLAPLYWNDGLEGKDSSLPVPVLGK